MIKNKTGFMVYIMSPRFFFFSLVFFYLLFNIPNFLYLFLFIGNVTFGVRVRFLAEHFRLLDDLDKMDGE